MPLKNSLACYWMKAQCWPAQVFLPRNKNRSKRQNWEDSWQDEIKKENVSCLSRDQASLKWALPDKIEVLLLGSSKILAKVRSVSPRAGVYQCMIEVVGVGGMWMLQLNINAHWSQLPSSLKRKEMSLPWPQDWHPSMLRAVPGVSLASPLLRTRGKELCPGHQEDGQGHPAWAFSPQCNDDMSQV